MNLIGENFSNLESLLYFGRAITIGTTPKGRSFVAYILTARSSSHQSRILEYNKEPLTIKTKITEPSLNISEKERNLLEYSPIMALNKDIIIAGNGVHTDLFQETFDKNKYKNLGSVGKVFSDFLIGGFYKNNIDVTKPEPDKYSTPRIFGFLDNSLAFLGIVKKGGDDESYQRIFNFNLKPGIAETITTYGGRDDKTLSSFSGNPLETNLTLGDPREITECLYNVSNKNYIVSVALIMKKKRELDVFILNKEKKLINEFLL